MSCERCEELEAEVERLRMSNLNLHELAQANYEACIEVEKERNSLRADCERLRQLLHHKDDTIVDMSDELATVQAKLAAAVEALEDVVLYSCGESCSRNCCSAVAHMHAADALAKIKTENGPENTAGTYARKGEQPVAGDKTCADNQPGPGPDCLAKIREMEK